MLPGIAYLLGCGDQWLVDLLESHYKSRVCNYICFHAVGGGRLIHLTIVGDLFGLQPHMVGIPG